MLARLDAFLLGRVFQGVVNLSGRDPVWWARQCAVLYLLLSAMVCVLDGWTWWRVLGLLLSPLFFAPAFLAPDALRVICGATFWRRFMLALELAGLLLSVLIFAKGRADAGLVCADAAGLAFLAFVYFPCCLPPPPPRPRGRLALGGAS